MLTQTPPAIRRSSFFALWSAAALLLFVGGLMPAAPASAQTEVQPAPATNNVISFDIPAQDLSDALSDFARQSGQDLLYRPEQASGRTAAAVQGAMTTAEAMRRLLTDTGLEFEFHHTGSMLIGDQATLEYYRRQLESPGSAAAGQDTPGNQIGQRRPGIEEIIVTGQKKEERIQDVPIAISAFSADDLQAQKLEGGFDLLKAIPNVTFSKNNFTGYNFSIRGIGTKAISATTDPGVAVAFNNSGLIVNRLFEQEYFDIERVEVLRGPQGTLYGRNATSGVINVISAKPELGHFAAEGKIEVGNYNTRRASGMVNLPVTDELAVRIAGAMTKRDGYGTNLAADDGADVSRDVDDRDLYSTRLTVAFQPNDALRVTALWEHFNEDDNRLRTSKQLCHRDNGPTEVQGVPVPANRRFFYSQGCKAGSLYDEGAFGVPYGLSLPYVTAAIGDGSKLDIDFDAGQDVYSGVSQSDDLREIESLIEPVYRAKADIFDLTIDANIGDSLNFVSQSLYTRDSVYSTQDLNRFATAPIFHDTTENPGVYNPGLPAFDDYYNALSPGGFYCDPQLGCSDKMVGQDLSQSQSTQFNQEFRISSSFDGSFNFSLGANYTHFQTLNDYYVFINILTFLADTIPVLNPPAGINDTCYYTGDRCVYVDPNPLSSIDGDGHNYFRSKNPYRLRSHALFGEVYWDITDTLTLTAGARMTWDRKDFTPVPSQTLLYDYRDVISAAEGGPTAPPENCTTTGEVKCLLAGSALNGRGYPAEPDIVQTWAEPTGRLVLDWQPAPIFDWQNETMFYASVARGYKGGGANPPGIAAPQGVFNTAGRTAVAPETFEPEYINALEVGTKNSLLNRTLMLNASAFYYDYTDYQVSKIVDRTSVNENFDATIWGLELEWVLAPTPNLQLNGTVGYLNTRIADGEESIDLMDRVQGGNKSFTTPDGRTFDEWMIVKPFLTQTSNCIVPAEYVAAVLEHNATVPAFQEANASSAFCAAGDNNGNTYAGGPPIEIFPGIFVPAPGVPGTPPGTYFDPTTDAPNGGAGFSADLSGNELPNAPSLTASFGAQYTYHLSTDWAATVRGDFYWQDDSYARVYNTEYDRLRSWTNTNLSVWVANESLGLQIEAYVKNAFDETPITDAFLFSDDTGLTTNVFTLDPRLIGVSIRKRF